MKLAHSEIAQFCRNLALLLHAGISLADGIFLICQEQTGAATELLRDLGKQLDEGLTLGEAMERSGAFPRCAAGMVSIGEQTGRTEEVLELLAQFYEQRHRTAHRIRQSLAYPAVILGMLLIVIGVLLVQVLPVFDEVYASFGSRMHGVAAWLLQLGQLLKGALPVLLVILAAAAMVAVVYAYCPPARQRLQRAYTARFGDRGAARKFNNAHFARGVAMGLAAALPLEQALEQAGKLLEDVPAAAERCARSAQALREGKSLAEAMTAGDFLPPSESRLLAVALREGSGDRAMADIADRLMEAAEEALETAAARVEPAMVLIASLLVGVILLAVMLPLMNIMAVIG